MSDQFGEIYDQYVVKIYRFIFLKVESQETAEDLCSEVFTKAFLECQKSEIRNMQAFLYQIARHVIADYYRDRASFHVVSLNETEVAPEEENAVFEQAALRLEIEAVKKALADLREEYQNFIIWRYLDELSIPEIAQITGKTEGSVRIGVHRALEALKGRVETSQENVPSMQG